MSIIISIIIINWIWRL